MHSTLKAVVSHRDPVTHGHGRDSVFFFAHLAGWAVDVQAKGILKNVRNNDGIEAWRQLARRFNPQTAHIPIIMVTSEAADSAHMANIQQTGVNALCDKPFEATEVRRMLATLLST